MAMYEERQSCREQWDSLLTELAEAKHILSRPWQLSAEEISCWTNNNQNIIWFDFNEMDKLENWVSEILKKPFKLHSINSSKQMECKITLNDEFKKKYDSIYNYYDFPKLKMTGP